jgi:hypothetical protein
MSGAGATVSAGGYASNSTPASAPGGLGVLEMLGQQRELDGAGSSFCWRARPRSVAQVAV